MEYITQRELKKMMLLSYQRIEEKKEEINKINVFPVPDQDTGNNLSKTLLGIKAVIDGKEFKDLKEISEAALDGALGAAQGNAGVIYTGFLAGFLPVLSQNPDDSGHQKFGVGTDVKTLALAFRKGAERARKSIQNPKDGTILDVIDATAETFEKKADKEKDIVKILKLAIEDAKEALMETREKMEIFKKANVVDAGGFGFLMILESYLEALEPSVASAGKGKEMPSEKIRKFVQILSNRYEVVSLIKDLKLNENLFREKLKKLGNSIDMVGIGNKIKLHIHTDYPDEVRDLIKQMGEILDLRIEDMAKEVVGEESVRKVSIGIVTEDLAMLLSKIIERYQIELAFTDYEWPPEKDLPGKNIYQKMREADKRGIKVFAKTSQASPKSYLDAFEKQLKKFEKVICITVSSKVSGCYNSAKQAEEMIKNPEKIFVLDSLNLPTLLVLRAIDLIQEQWEFSDVIKKLKKIIPEIRTYLIVEDPKWIESLGRITKSQANWIRGMKKLRLYPIMEFKGGTIGRGGIVFAESSGEAMFKKILKEWEKTEGKKIRVVIGHADNLPEAEKLKKLLKQRIKVDIPFINLAPPIICAGTGPGTLIVSWMPLED